MAIGAYLAAKELGREKEMIFVDWAAFVCPFCVDKTVEIALKMLRDPQFKPEKEIRKSLAD